MAVRAQWKGFLKLALLSCPVALYTAASQAGRISLHMLNRKTGHRLRRDYVDEQTGRTVAREDQAKGFEVDTDRYVVVSQDEIDAAIPASTKTIEIDSFVPIDQVDDIYLDAPYYLAPASAAGAELFSLIRKAMEAKKVAGLARVVLFRRDRVLLLRPEDKGILISTLHYDYEVQQPSEVFAEIPDRHIKGEMLKLAEHIIGTKKGKLALADFHDRYEAALADLIKAKKEGRKLPIPSRPQGGNVVNLLDALRQSASAKKSAAKSATKGANGRKAAATRRKGRSAA